MPTLHTKRVLVFVRADSAVAANQRSKLHVDQEGGERTWDVPLEKTATPGVVAAYVCAWSMRPGQFNTLKARLQEIEIDLSDKVRFFDVSGLSPEEEQAFLRQRLSNLGLQFMQGG